MKNFRLHPGFVEIGANRFRHTSYDQRMKSIRNYFNLYYYYILEKKYHGILLADRTTRPLKDHDKLVEIMPLLVAREYATYSVHWIIPVGRKVTNREKIKQKT